MKKPKWSATITHQLVAPLLVMVGGQGEFTFI